MSENLFNKVDAGRYHEVMRCLKDMQLGHGTCQPRERMACTHCNAKDRLDILVKEYKGPRVVAARVSNYGWCPVCGVDGVGASRERSPNGDTTCRNGHKEKSTTWLLEAP